MKHPCIAFWIIASTICVSACKYADEDHEHDHDHKHTHVNPLSGEWFASRPNLYPEYAVLVVDVVEKQIAFDNSCTCDVHFGGDMDYVDNTTIFHGDEIMAGHYVVSDCTEVSQCSHMVHTGAYSYAGNTLTMSLPDETVTYIKW